MTPHSVNAIIKIGQPEHIKSLQKQGEVYLNTWEYFRRHELNNAQGDKHEGLAEIFQVANGHKLYIKAGEEWLPIGGLKDQLKFFAGNQGDFNLFCMFALMQESQQHLGHPDLLQFGTAALVMTDGDAFISRLTRKLDEEGIPHHQALAEYVEKDLHEGEMGPFRKLSEFSYQSEWRVCAHARKGGPIKLFLGDLSDISVLVPTSELTQRIRFDL